MSKKFIGRDVQGSEAAVSDHHAGLAHMGGKREEKELNKKNFEVQQNSRSGSASSPLYCFTRMGLP